MRTPPGLKWKSQPLAIIKKKVYTFNSEASVRLVYKNFHANYTQLDIHQYFLLLMK